MKKYISLVAIILVFTIAVVALSSASLYPFRGEEPWVIRVTKSVPVDENGEITTHNQAVKFVQIDITIPLRPIHWSKCFPLCRWICWRSKCPIPQINFLVIGFVAIGTVYLIQPSYECNIVNYNHKAVR